MQKRFAWLINKYVLTLIGFAVWMIWFDTQDLPGELHKAARYKELQASEAALKSRIAASRNELNQLITNLKTVEQYAREKYLMKKDNEELFIVAEGNQGK